MEIVLIIIVISILSIRPSGKVTSRRGRYGRTNGSGRRR